MVIILAPNSTPMVKSCTGWKRLSVNCKRRHDLPTPAKSQNAWDVIKFDGRHSNIGPGKAFSITTMNNETKNEKKEIKKMWREKK